MNTVEERFWEKVEIGGPDECWAWRGTISPNNRSDRPGYGMFSLNGKSRLAHQVALELSGYSRLPDKRCALHSCDNSMCVNPAHLRWGTHKENMADAISRGRYVKVTSAKSRGGVIYHPA